MTSTSKNIYKAFGLIICSEISMPELPQIVVDEEVVDVEIIVESLSAVKTDLSTSKGDFLVTGNTVSFQIPETATFSIQSGRKIIVSPCLGSDESEIRLFILGTCMGAILFQRNILPLHGSAIAINGKAYAFVGDSGAGKSTLASAFLQKGYQLISDDVIPVSFTEEGLPIVTPSYPQQKLWQESLSQFGMEANNYRQLFARETKYAVPVNKQFFSKLLPLGGIFELVKTNNDEIEILPISNLQSLHTLFYHTYRNFLLSPSGLMEWHFNASTSILNKVRINRLKRPISRFSAYDLTEKILVLLQKEESAKEFSEHTTSKSL